MARSRVERRSQSALSAASGGCTHLILFVRYIVVVYLLVHSINQFERLEKPFYASRTFRAVSARPAYCRNLSSSPLAVSLTLCVNIREIKRAVPCTCIVCFIVLRCLRIFNLIRTVPFITTRNITEQRTLCEYPSISILTFQPSSQIIKNSKISILYISLSDV